MYLQVVGGSEQYTCHQVGVSPQVMDTLLCGGAEHLHTLSCGTQQEPAATNTTMSYTEIHSLQTNNNHVNVCTLCALSYRRMSQRQH